MHFLGNIRFYDEIILGERMYVMLLMRATFMICVPLFFMLSGYLMSKIKLDNNYYVKRIRVIIIYVLASIVCEIFRIVFLQEEKNIIDIVMEIISFNVGNYSWYIELYLGLILIIPFLNVMWNTISDKQGKKILIVSLIFISSLPSVINVYNFKMSGWWSSPIISTEYQKIIPDSWSALYPITYYMIGCYLKDFRLSIKKSINFILIVLTICAYGTYMYWRNKGSVFVNGAWCQWYSFFVVILTTLVFNFIIGMDFSKTPNKIRAIAKFISDLTLGAYLVSVIFDIAFYDVLRAKIEIMPQRLNYYIVMVPAVFLCSLILSFIIECVYRLIHLIFQKLAYQSLGRMI